MRKGRLARLARLGGMAMGLVGDAAAATTHLVSSDSGVGASFHGKAAQRLLKVFGEMKGLPMKAGQMLSYIDEILPEEHRKVYAKLLGGLQARTPPVSWEAIEQVFKADFDGRGPEELFAHIEHEPMAAASIGQVYVARLADGREVAVKVQYPGEAAAVRYDQRNVESLVGAMSALMPRADMRPFVEDIVAKLADECDYELEAQAQTDFATCWADDAWVRVPAVVPEYSSRRVLTSELLHAKPWAEMLEAASAEERRIYGATIFRFVFQSLFCYGMFNGDPHPGNYLFYPGGKVAFIDYGCVQRYTDDQASAFRELRLAVLSGDSGPHLRALLDRAFGLPPDLDDQVHKLLADYFLLSFEPVTAPQPYRFERAYTRRLLNMGMEAKKVLTKRMIFSRKANPFGKQTASITFLGRINFGLGSILATLGGELDCRSIIAELPL